MAEPRDQNPFQASRRRHATGRSLSAFPAVVFSARPVEHRFDVAELAADGYADVLDGSEGAGATADEARLVAAAGLLAARISRVIALHGPGRHEVVVQVEQEHFLHAVRLAQAAADISGRRIDVALGASAPIVVLCPKPGRC